MKLSDVKAGNIDKIYAVIKTEFLQRYMINLNRIYLQQTGKTINFSGIDKAFLLKKMLIGYSF